MVTVVVFTVVVAVVVVNVFILYRFGEESDCFLLRTKGGPTTVGSAAWKSALVFVVDVYVSLLFRFGFLECVKK